MVVPFGEHPGVGLGGHVAGGAFGFLCRQLGLVADWLYGVEVVTVGADRRASVVVATREANDPNRELWWAHTGGGAGTFGVATRFWFRAPDATGDDPALPRAPESITTLRAEWPWDAVDEPTFRRLLASHGEWAERHAGPDSPSATLWALLELRRREAGAIVVRGVSTAGDGAERQIDAHVAALGLGAPARRDVARLPWRDFAVNPLPDMFAMPPGGVRVKVKDVLLRRRLDDRQVGVAWRWLTRDDHVAPGGMLGLMTYGGRVGAVAPDATASARRRAILGVACNVGWLDAADDARNLAWVRGFYAKLWAATGGVPVPDDACDGALINHPDADLAASPDWPAVYWQGNYARPQRAKARWDPRDVFRHALSVRLPSPRAAPAAR